MYDITYRARGQVYQNVQFTLQSELRGQYLRGLLVIKNFLETKNEGCEFFFRFLRISGFESYRILRLGICSILVLRRFEPEPPGPETGP